MKFVFFGYDYMLDPVLRLTGKGHELLKIYSFPCDNRFNYNNRTQKFAQKNNIPFELQAPTAQHIRNDIQNGTELFLSAGYPFRIPIAEDSNAVFINFHPSYLPHGRGLMPVPKILLNAPEAAGATLHVMERNFDSGPIILQQKIDLDEYENVESYAAKSLLLADKMLQQFFDNPDHLIARAKTQDESKASIFKAPTADMRRIDWNNSVKNITSLSRAFGRYGCVAAVNDKNAAIYDLSGWVQPHDYEPGNIFADTGSNIIIACSNGYICIKDYEFLS